MGRASIRVVSISIIHIIDNNNNNNIISIISIVIIIIIAAHVVCDRDCVGLGGAAGGGFGDDDDFGDDDWNFASADKEAPAAAPAPAPAPAPAGPRRTAEELLEEVQSIAAGWSAKCSGVTQVKGALELLEAALRPRGGVRFV